MKIKDLDNFTKNIEEKELPDPLMESESLKTNVKHPCVKRILNQTVLGHIESYYTIFSKVTAGFTRNKKIYSSAGISSIKLVTLRCVINEMFYILIIELRYS